MIQTFVIIHSQKLIDENRRKFSSLPNLTYLAVGKDDFKEASDVVICRNLPDNIESYWRLLHWTAFYAVIKNGLINPKATHVRFLEWDVTFDGSYNANSMAAVKSGKQIYGHKKSKFGYGFLVADREWLRLEQLVRNAYLYLNGRSFAPELRRSKVCNGHWIETTNLVFSIDGFRKYFEWGTQYVPFLINGYKEADPEAGNSLERLTTVYCASQNVEFEIINGLKNAYSQTWNR